MPYAGGYRYEELISLVFHPLDEIDLHKEDPWPSHPGTKLMYLRPSQSRQLTLLYTFPRPRDSCARISVVLAACSPVLDGSDWTHAFGR
jgi:hypothetical protein